MSPSMAQLKDLNIYAFGDTIQLAGAVFQGEGRTFLCFFPEDKNDQPIEPLELSLADWTALVRQTDLLETEILTKATDGTLAKIILRKSQRQIDSGVQWRCFQRDNYACRYCGVSGVPLTVDHLVTWENGGPTIEANLLSACKKCNKVRGNLPYADWLKHTRYCDLSRNLSPEVREANAALVSTLPSIPLRTHTPSR